MPSTPRARDAATLCAVLLAIVLAFLWLRSSDGAAPRVPAGLSVATLPAAVPERLETPSEATATTTGIEGERAGRDRPVRKPRKADRSAQRGHPARAARRARRSPPAIASAPSAGSGTAGAPSGTARAPSGATSTPAPPEFALE